MSTAISAVLCTLDDICVVTVQTESMSATYIKPITIIIIIMIIDHARQVIFAEDSYVYKTCQCLLLYSTVSRFVTLLSFYIPVQLNPSPVYPVLQVQVILPSVILHTA